MVGEESDMNADPFRRRRAHTAPFVLGVVAFFIPATSVSSPLSARVEAGGSVQLSSPQRSLLGVGYVGRLDVGLRLLGPLVVHAFGAAHRWPASDVGAQEDPRPGMSLLFGGGVGVEPRLGSRVRLRVEVELGASLNGSEASTRLYWGGGAGVWIRAADVFDVGPMVRFGSVVASGDEAAGQGGPGSAYFLSFGVAISIHPREQLGEVRPSPRIFPVEPHLPPPIVAAPAMNPSVVVTVIPSPVPTVTVVTAPPTPVAVENVAVPVVEATSTAPPDVAPSEAAPPSDEEPDEHHHGRRHRADGHRGGHHGGGEHREGHHHGERSGEEQPGEDGDSGEHHHGGHHREEGHHGGHHHGGH